MKTGSYDSLTLPDRLIAEIGSRPRGVIYTATIAAALIAWIWLIIVSGGALSLSSAQSLGPGTEFLTPILDKLTLWAEGSPLLGALIRFCSPQLAAFSWTGFLATFLMWCAMSIAMMLPSAAPMLRTYGDIAHVAREKGETTVPLAILAWGYLFLWGVFALVAAAFQTLLITVGLVSDAVSPTLGTLSGLILLGAGAYQFSGLKDACLEKCRNPFNTLFAQWRTDYPGVFKLGMQQGAFCVGCCWALMLVMLVVGTMNLAWMAFLTLFAIVEKSAASKVTSQISGGILIVWGGILLAFVALGYVSG